MLESAVQVIVFDRLPRRLESSQFVPVGRISKV
jgi:hypothetical protein